MRGIIGFYKDFFDKIFNIVFDLTKTFQKDMESDTNLQKRIKTACVFGFIFLVCLFSGGFLTNALFVTIGFIVYYEILAMISVNRENYEVYKKQIILATIYVSLPFSSLLTINNHGKGHALIFWFFCVIWATDIGAFFVGRSVGGKKLMPLVSPGKTVSGSIGGLVCAFFVGFFMSFLSVGTQLQNLGIASFGFIAVVISVFAQCGDLLESYIKRKFGVKDSGTILPGHGGMMDRMDSVTFAAPVFLFIIKKIGF